MQVNLEQKSNTMKKLIRKFIKEQIKNLAEASNNPYYNAIEAKAKKAGTPTGEYIKNLLKNKSGDEVDQMGYQDIAKFTL